MHEFGIAQNIFDAVSKEIENREVSKVISIKLEIGKLTAIVPSALEFCFESLAEGTLMDGVELIFIDIPLKMKCKECGTIYEVEDYYCICPECSSIEYELISGDELIIKQIEVE